MTSGDGSREDAERVAEALDKIGRDELVESVKEGMKALKEADSTHETVDGSDDETRYLLSEDRLPSGQYHDLARTITKTVLDVSPREVTTVEVTGIEEFLRNRDEKAVNTLLECGISYVETNYNDGTLEGRGTATRQVVEAVLRLYMPGLIEAHFLDHQGDAIAARFDDTLQYYWLPDAGYRRLGERLDMDLLAAVVTPEELERIREEKRDNM